MAFVDSGASVGDVPDADSVPVTVAGRQLLLFRLNDQIHATQRRCLHQGADLSDGIVAAGHVICAVHGWRFDIRTGVHADSPYNCLRTYPVEVRDGRVYVNPTPNPLAQVPE